MTDEPTGEPGPGLPRSPSAIAAGVLAVLLTLCAIGWSAGVPRAFGFAPYSQQFIAVILSLTLPIAFLMFPARRGSHREAVPWYDWGLAAIGLGAGLFIAVSYPDLVNQIFFRPVAAYLPGGIVVLLVLEALRRATGWPLVIIVVVFLLYALFGDMLPGRLSGRAQDVPKLAAYLAFDINGILGIPMAVATTIVVAFIFFGKLLGASGGSKFFTDAALLGMGRYRGGSMKIAVAASGLFGSISGSAVANVVATGVITIPMIKRDGYPAHKAGAIEAVSSTGGQLMPPVMGAAAFLMAEFLQVPYSTVVLAALVPALLYYAALFIQADLEAARLGIARVPEKDIPTARTVASGLHFLLAFAVLIYALFWLKWQPEKAALGAAVSVFVTAIVFGYEAMRPRIATLLRTLWSTGHQVVEIILISAAAGMVIGVLNVSGLSFNLTYALVQLGGGDPVILLVIAALICIVLGMGLPTLGVYVLLAALVAPALVEVGIEPIAAHLFVLYFGMMSMITPPIALAAYAAAGVANAHSMATGLAAVRFGWTAYVIPFLFVFSPTLILVGAPLEIALAIVTAGIGVWLVSAAIAGYFARRMASPVRIGFAVAGLMALVPASAFTGALVTDLVGVILGVALMSFEIFRARQDNIGAERMVQ